MTLCQRHPPSDCCIAVIGWCLVRLPGRQHQRRSEANPLSDPVMWSNVWLDTGSGDRLRGCAGASRTRSNLCCESTSPESRSGLVFVMLIWGDAVAFCVSFDVNHGAS